MNTIAHAFEKYNVATGGKSAAQLLARAATTVDVLYTQRDHDIVVVMMGMVDIGGSRSAADTYADIVAYCTARRAAGWKVVVVPVLPDSYTGVSVDYNAKRATLNGLLAANWATFADGFSDYGADAYIGVDGCETNPTYWANAAHLNAAGYAVLAGYAKTAIVGLL